MTTQAKQPPTDRAAEAVSAMQAKGIHVTQATIANNGAITLVLGDGPVPAQVDPLDSVSMGR